MAVKKFQHQFIATASIVSFALAVRLMVSTHPHSGQGKPPMHGDYEAQRHWMEVTYNLPLADWYRNTSNNNLLYWGLDYPPLTAYHSLALGHIAARVNGSFVHLHKSRGIETYEHKVFMRLSVLLADVVTLVPALLSYYDDSGYFFLSLLYPGFIMIDYGHFQYNCVSLGLCLAAVIGVKKNHHILASVFFSLALNYKQMELYHALPFFIFLLRSCVDQPRGVSKIVKLLGLSLTVLVTFGMIWAPFLHNMNSALAVLQRLFPFDRGLYEDKVANVWCTSNVVIKWKQLFSAKSMATICLASTVVTCIPSGIHLFLQSSFKAFLYSLVNMSLAFFLFSYHVHEKSILLVAMPALLLFQENPLMTIWFLQISHFSLLSIGLLCLKPPVKYPDLFTLVEVVDQSDGCGAKFEVLIVSDKFEGKPLLQRHRGDEVNPCLLPADTDSPTMERKTVMSVLQCTVRSPLKLILSGEHSVVYGKTALAASVGIHLTGTFYRLDVPNLELDIEFMDKQWSWSVTCITECFSKEESVLTNSPVPPSSQDLELCQSILPEPVNFHDPRSLAPLAFIFLYSKLLRNSETGLRVVISLKSHWPGLGNSAAYAVTLAAGFLFLTGVINKELDAASRKLVCDWAYMAEKIMHGSPSGVDNTICSYGGVIKYIQGEFHMIPGEHLASLQVLIVNSGVEKNTRKQVEAVAALKQEFNQIVAKILEAMDEITIKILGLVSGGLDWKQLEDLVRMNQCLLSSLGVSHPRLERILEIAREHGCSGKLTGAGGGGCAFIILPHPLQNEEQLIQHLTRDGFEVHRATLGFANPDLPGYLGFANLPNQVHRKFVKKGFEFTLMIAGEAGLGKTTLVNSLFLTDLYPERVVPSAAEKIQATVRIEASTVEIEERGVKLRLTVVDTPGFGDGINSTDCFKSIIQYIDEQFERYLRDESGLNRRNIIDNRVHCCFYFISPFGHGLKPLDIEFMRQLHGKVNIVPVIAKADTLTKKEVLDLKRRVLAEIEENGIRIYSMPDTDSDEDDDYREQINQLKASIPFAVCGSTQLIEVKGQKVRGRLYPWGIVEVENPDHCDFIKLRAMLVMNMQDLQEVTQELHYENYRSERLAKGTPRKIGGVNVDENLGDKDRLLKEKEDELRRMQEMLTQMQTRMTASSISSNP
ncbi:unnamed protein product [Darwinula stevensoni]|uniref:Septin-type G domain-containing protein n=1 Tax=Darwinula stevensoni TaxID=69355 RepID=A0A7R9A3Q4_9CRUS|nr:unnamed protein product [Darwinula stevensoni]CAG0892072.1 unnamed protein product [Darwinula stevensoni]